MNATRIWTLDDLFAQPDPEWLVEGLIPEKGDGLIYGATGTGKTFVTLDLALTIATGLPRWFGRKVKGGPVVYVAGEGAFGLKPRIEAWKRMHPDADPAFLVVPDGAQLMSAERTAELIAAIDGMGETTLSAVVFDTWTRVTAGADQNDSMDVGIALASAAAIRQHFSCSTWFIHHPGHDLTRPRGSSSLLQAVDWAIQFQLSDGNRVMKCEKMRDAGPFAPIGFRLAKCPPSLMVEPEEAPEQTESLDREEARAFEVLCGAAGPLSYTAWWTGTGQKESTFKRKIKSLLEKGLARKGALGYEGPRVHEGPKGSMAPGLEGPKGPPLGRVDPGPDRGPDSEDAIEREAMTAEGM